MRIKFIGGGLALVVAVAYLAFAGLKDGWVYHVPVDMFIASPEMHSQRVRLHGKVSEEALEASPAKLYANFQMIGGGQVLPVSYKGAVPDLFKAGVEVVVEGRMDASGVFKADVLLTKCASKYQSEEHAKHDQGT